MFLGLLTTGEANLWGFLVLLVIPFAVFFVLLRKYKRDRDAKFEFPIKNKKEILRPPGWSLRRRISDLEDDILPWFVAAVFWPFFLGLYYLLTAGYYFGIVVLVIIGTILASIKISRLFTKLVHCNQGLKGEEIVGYQLMTSLNNDCEIYHDLEFAGIGGKQWNIDHVVVSSVGVFVIETKCKSKIKGLSGNHVALAEGQVIKFPDSTYNDSWIKQVKRNGLYLSEKLSIAIADDLKCVPVIVMPGWYTKQENRDEASYLLMNVSFLVGYIQRQPSVLSDKQQQRISTWLKNYCHTDVK